MLLTQDCVVSEDATRERAYMRYIKKNYKSWLQFAVDQDYNVVLGDLILVTGHDTTGDYAMAAFANNSTTLRIAFQAGFPGVPAPSISAWGRWQTSPFVYHNCGPISSPIHVASSGPAMLARRGSTSADSSMDSGEQSSLLPPESPGAGETSSFDFTQCIFLRGYRMRERKPLSPAVISAAAIGANPGGPSRESPRSASLVVRGGDEAREDAEDSDNISFYSDTTPVCLNHRRSTLPP